MTSKGRPVYRAREILVEAEAIAKAAGINQNPVYRDTIQRVAGMPLADKFQRAAALDKAKRVHALAVAAMHLSGNPWPSSELEAEHAI